MAFSPAWGGVIPLVQIGSFKDFLGQRRKGKELRIWYASTISRAVVEGALRTTVGKQFIKVLQSQVMARFGYTPSASAIGVELQAYMAFMKFQRQNAKSSAQVATLDQTMSTTTRSQTRPQEGRLNTIPEGYFQQMVRTLPQPEGELAEGRRRTRRKRDKKDLLSWFERRKRRGGRFVNV